MRSGGPKSYEVQRLHRHIRGLRHGWATYGAGMALALFCYDFDQVWYGVGMILLKFGVGQLSLASDV